MMATPLTALLTMTSGDAANVVIFAFEFIFNSPAQTSTGEGMLAHNPSTSFMP
jgi:hypothetical protein